ncbi:MAG: protein translocase SEC61 complex subunit gamma [Candidatus Thorarchaeota archaeon]
MGLSKFISDSRRILKLATRPSREEMSMSLKISLLAMFLVGFLSFVIQLVMTLITTGW